MICIMIKIKRVRTHAQLPGARVRVCRPACMRKRHSTVRARVRVNEFAIEFEENLRIRWQKNNRAPLICLLNQLLNTNSRNASVSLCFQQNTLLPLADVDVAFGHHCFWASARDASACVSLSSLASSWLAARHLHTCTKRCCPPRL